MLNEIKFAIYAIKMNIAGSAELRASFIMNVFGMAINNISFIIIWVAFVKAVGTIGGWQAIDIVGLQGFTALGFGIVYSFCGGLRRLPITIANGSFDRIMLSPKSLLIRTATSHFFASAVGDILFGIITLTIFAVAIQASIWQILMGIVLVIISTTIFLSAAIVTNSAGFYFTDATFTSTGFFEIFMTPTLFHGGAFQGVLRFVFTFAIPSLIAGALPVEIFRSLSLPQLFLILGLASAWLAIAIKVFNIGVRRYESANFMTFGN